MKLRWTSRARRDLLGITAFIAADNRTAARKWVKQIREQARRSVDFPLSGRMVPEYGRADLREFVVGNFRIVYRVLQDEVHVLLVFEGHRLMPETLDGATAQA